MKRVMKVPSEAHKKAMRSRGDSFSQFMRNGVWGTCVDCPRDSNENAYPEFCEHALRSDHQLEANDLFETYASHSR